VLRFADGALTVPTGPGLGVELDRDAVDRLHALYDSAGVRDRDDTDEIRKYIPDFVRQVPKW
jgi:glucarate dehydratase